MSLTSLGNSLRSDAWVWWLRDEPVAWRGCSLQDARSDYHNAGSAADLIGIKGLKTWQFLLALDFLKTCFEF
jgi:hypothetical protein